MRAVRRLRTNATPKNLCGVLKKLCRLPYEPTVTALVQTAAMHLQQRTMRDKRSCRMSDSLLGLESTRPRQDDDRLRYAKMELHVTGSGYAFVEVCRRLDFIGPYEYD